MIDENLTYKFYGYHSFDWNNKSNKYVIVICDKCGMMRSTRIVNSYRLCNGCSVRGRKQSEEAKRRIKEYQINKIFSKETRKKISEGKIGKNNPNWKGGLSFEEYSQNFNISLKRAIRYKYNNCDFFSGLHRNIINNKTELSVHHIDYNKDNCDINNLIPLSVSNHIKTNYNRWFWKKLIKNTQKIDRWYYEY